MNNNLSRAKKFVRDHAFSLGIAVGCAGFVTIVVLSRSTQLGAIYRLSVTPEQLTQLLHHPESVVAFNITPQDRVWIINSTTKEIFP